MSSPKNTEVGSDNDDGVFSNNFDTSTLVNYGGVNSGAAVGVLFNGLNDIIDNEAGASIPEVYRAKRLDSRKGMDATQLSIFRTSRVTRSGYSPLTRGLTKAVIRPSI